MKTKIFILVCTICLIAACKESKKDVEDTSAPPPEENGEITADMEDVEFESYLISLPQDEVVSETIDQLNLNLSPAEINAFSNAYKTNADKTTTLVPSDIPDILPPDCWIDRPKTIQELTDGVLIYSYSFDKDDQAKLGLLGFLNVDITNKQKVMIVEYSQSGSQYCNDKKLKYGVGARLMMKITNYKNNARLNTPQQVTASVIFGRAEVTYSLQTFGITGAGIAQLNKTGSLTENTYPEFRENISELIQDIYSEDSSYIITPQLLPLQSFATQ